MPCKCRTLSNLGATTRNSEGSNLPAQSNSIAAWATKNAAKVVPKPILKPMLKSSIASPGHWDTVEGTLNKISRGYFAVLLPSTVTRSRWKISKMSQKLDAPLMEASSMKLSCHRRS